MQRYCRVLLCDTKCIGRHRSTSAPLCSLLCTHTLNWLDWLSSTRASSSKRFVNRNIYVVVRGTLQLLYWMIETTMLLMAYGALLRIQVIITTTYRRRLVNKHHELWQQQDDAPEIYVLGRYNITYWPAIRGLVVSTHRPIWEAIRRLSASIEPYITAWNEVLIAMTDCNRDYI